MTRKKSTEDLWGGLVNATKLAIDSFVITTKGGTYIYIHVSVLQYKIANGEPYTLIKT